MGLFMVLFPLEPKISRILIQANLTSEDCFEDTLTIISVMNYN